MRLLKLRVKDFVNLTQLNKYDFTENEDGDYYNLQVAQWGKGKWFLIDHKTREFDFYWSDLGNEYDFDNECNCCEYVVNTLLDLLQDGIIERFTED